MAYKIGIATDTATSLYIYYNNEKKSAANYGPNLLNCEAYTPFWVQWKDGFIQLGHGSDRGETIMISWPNMDKSMTVNAISMTTDGVIGQWEFVGIHGMYCIY